MIKEVNVYESYGLEDSKFKIKVNKEFEYRDAGFNDQQYAYRHRRTNPLQYLYVD